MSNPLRVFRVFHGKFSLPKVAGSRYTCRMTIEQTVDIPAGAPCPLCAKHTAPVTGEKHLNAKTIAAIEEVEAMVRGDIPAKWYHSLEELLADLDAVDEDD
jgi:hypothetical protein